MTNELPELYEVPEFFEAVEFLVHKVSFNGTFIVTGGRLLSGKIAPNNIFNLVFEPMISTKEDQYRRIGRQNERQINLRVESIEAFHRRIDLMDRGLTGQLELSGHEDIDIHPGQILAIVI